MCSDWPSWGWTERTEDRCAKSIALVSALAVACVAACGGSERPARYGAHGTRLGSPLTFLGWEMTLSNLRWEVDYALIDVKAQVAGLRSPRRTR